jgi:hypothetical protein
MAECVSDSFPSEISHLATKAKKIFSQHSLTFKHSPSKLLQLTRRCGKNNKHSARCFHHLKTIFHSKRKNVVRDETE